MKRFLLLMLLFSLSASAQYEKKWETLLRLEKDGRTRSAYAMANDIFESSEKAGNEPQLIKSFFYKAKFMMVLEPGAQAKILALLDREKAKASVPTAALLDLMYARCLADYKHGSNNVYNNKDSDSANPNFKLWNESAFEKAIAKRLDDALSKKEALKAATLEKYEPVFDFLKIEEFKQMTVYEYLLLESIDIAKWERDYVYPTLQDPLLFAESDVFCRTDFRTDNADNKKIIALYQELERFRPSGIYRFARINFVTDAVSPDKGAYLKTLDRWTRQKTDIDLWQKILYEKAKYFQRNADVDKFPDYFIKAEKIADSILQSGKKSNAYWRAHELKQDLYNKSISLKMPEVLYAGEKARFWVAYRNVDSLEVSFRKISNKDFIYLQESKWAADSLMKLPRYRTQATERYALPSKVKDYYAHSTELWLPQLPIGQYLMAYSTKDIKGERATVYKTITVSEFAPMVKRMNELEYYQVLNRKTGFPEKGVTIVGELGKALTDKDGESAVAYGQKYRQALTLFRGSDTLTVSKDYIRSIDANAADDFTAQTFFYLDRPIFRPGQKVFYKGITIQKKGVELKVAAHIPQEITLEDEDGKTIRTFEVITNEYGSFSGSFDLPADGPNGTYTLTADEPDDAQKGPPYNDAKTEHPFWDNVRFENSSVDFRVEEYKRPKFEVMIDEIPGSPKTGEKVMVTGKARAFDGSVMSHSTVKCMVRRRVKYDEKTQSNTCVIADTLITADGNGKFSTSFVLDPGEEVKGEKSQQTYTFSAAVTDISGETHETAFNFNAGNYVLRNGVAVPTGLTSAHPAQITLSATDLNYKAIPVTGTVSIFKTGKFYSKFRPSAYPKPDRPVITEAELEKYFPFEDDLFLNGHDEYENDKSLYQKDSLVATFQVNTLKSGTLPTAFMKSYPSGYYKVVFKAVDHDGNAAENEASFTFEQERDLYNPSKWLTVRQLNQNPVADGFVRFRVTSPFENLSLHISAQYKNAAFYEVSSSLKDHELTFNIPVGTKLENNIGINFECFYDNSLFTWHTTVALETETPKMDFESSTFRSKIAPGAEQQWSFKLKGEGSANAEVLANMYDASLDAFGASDWTLPYLSSTYSGNFFLRNALGTQMNSFSIYSLNHYRPSPEYRNEDVKMLWFGFDFNGRKISNEAYQKQLARKAPLPPGGRMVSGIVKDDEGMPLPGVNIVVAGTDRGTTTDLDGFYEIYAKKSEKLEFSFVGMASLTLDAVSIVNDVTLTYESLETVEIITEGYSRTSAKRSLASAVSVKTAHVPKTELASALEGYVPGVTLISSDSTSTGGIGTYIRGMGSISGGNDKQPLIIIDGVPATLSQLQQMDPKELANIAILKDTAATSIYGSRGANGVMIVSTKAAVQELKSVKARTNLSETAFFLPELHTDKTGSVSFSFTTPEALTEWKLRLLGHNKSARSAYFQKMAVTQKELAITPNFPRFVREKDTLTVRARISNLTLQPKQGKAMLQLFDANSMKEINAEAFNIENVKDFSAGGLASVAVSWKIAVPEGISGLQYRVVAKSGDFSDGEENIIPVLSNNILVTESIPLWVREKSRRTYTFGPFADKTATGLRQHQITIDYNTNPAWTAVAALPYLMEFEHECAEQTFARYYANTLAAFILKKNPKIASVLGKWNTGKPVLEKNGQLKSIALAETPWANDLKSIAEKRQQTAILLDTLRTKNEASKMLARINDLQMPSGGFSWFSGGSENTYITTHIVAGFGHLEALGIPIQNDEKKIITRAVSFLDKEFEKDMKRSVYSSYDLSYLYARSFYLKENPLPPVMGKAVELQLLQLAKHWLDYSLADKATAALVLYRFGDKATAAKILQSLRETAALNEDDGMYWLENKPGWRWNESPIEIQSQLIEAFTEIEHDKASVDAMKVWLLKKRQRSNWPTTKSTTAAIYAMLMNGSNWIEAKDNTIFRIGDEKLLSVKMKENEDSGNVYLEWNASEIKPGMQTLTVENKSDVPGYGGFYRQYFQDIDKVQETAPVALSVKKEYYVKSGDKLLPLSKPLKVGDKVTVRLTITAQSDFEFVHVKDARSSCFEPLDIHSGFQWEAGRGFYKSVKDTATHFFFDRLPEGTLHLEYEAYVNNSGVFSDAPVVIECMYAPEFSAHGNGSRIKASE